MKAPLVVSPLDTIDDVEKLVACGADEFYCGIFAEEWQKKYSPASIDRRPRGKSHFESWDVLKNAVLRAHDSGAKVNITINEHYYTSGQYGLIDSFIENVVSAKADSLTISDPALIFYAAEKKFPLSIHLSTGAVCLTAESARFFRDAAVSRIILPRHLPVKEIE